MNNIFARFRDWVTSEPEPGSRGYPDNDNGEGRAAEPLGEEENLEAAREGDNSMVNKQGKGKQGKGYGVVQMPGLVETPTHGVARQQGEKPPSGKLIKMPKVSMEFLGKRKPKTKAEQRAEREKELAAVGRGEAAGKQGMVTSTGGTEKLAEREASGRKLVTAGKPTTTGQEYKKPRAERIPRVTQSRGFRITPKRPKLPR